VDEKGHFDLAVGLQGTYAIEILDGESIISAETVRLDETKPRPVRAGIQCAIIGYPTIYTGSAPNYTPLQPVAGPSYSYTYDTMHRLGGMMDQSTDTSVVSNVQYGPANEMLTANYFGVYETRSYNARLQVTSIGVGNYADGANLENIQYCYSPSQTPNTGCPASANNGKISSQKDMISGEEVTATDRQRPNNDELWRDCQKDD
jgi:hypothetical protein